MAILPGHPALANRSAVGKISVTSPLARLVLPIVLMLAFAASVAAQMQTGWLPIPPEDLALSDNPAAPGSSAMILLKKESRDDIKLIWETYYRIKIFTEKGRSYGDIEIPFAPQWVEVDGLFARVTQSDGRSVDFSGPVYEKTLARHRKTRLIAKTFTLPEVQPGAIVEYRYRMKFKSAESLTGLWIVQENLWIREAQLELKPRGGGVRTLARALPPNSEFREDGSGSGVWRSTLRDLPAFEEEPHMPPENSLKMRYHLLYGNLRNVFFSWGDSLNSFIGKSKDLEKTVNELVSSQDPPELKLRKLYSAVQERVRNLSYEETYTKKERKREGMKERKSAADVWKYGYGTSEEIVLLFAAMGRAAGFAADVTRVAQRDSALPDLGIDLEDQLDGWLVLVDIPDRTMYFDPGTRFAPAGWVSWPNEGCEGRRYGKNLTRNIRVPVQAPEKNSRHARLSVALNADGSARLEAIITLSGEDAVERRNEFFDLSDKERERKLRKELEDSLPWTHVEQVSWSGMDDASDTARISYRIALPHLAQSMGSRLLVPVAPVELSSPFLNWKRKHSVYLRRSAHFVREIRITAPRGYAIEHLPESLNLNTALWSYTFSASSVGEIISARTQQTTQAALVHLDNYAALKHFYDRIAVNERRYLTLRKIQQE